MSFWKSVFGNDDENNKADITLPQQPEDDELQFSVSPASGISPMATKDSAHLKNRVIRVFVSSTFKDMKEEREVLVKEIFPQLRKMCEERGVTWGEVDLRWGVTDEQKAEGKVLPICLEEIKRCRPYFIGVLGERYGWIPDAISEDVLEREPWLAEYHHHSVTELEILHGVLNNPDMAEHAFFYFRNPDYLNRLPANAILSDYLSENEAAKTKLDDLKERIRQSPFPAMEDYYDPEAFGDLVLQDFKALIDHLYPPDDTLDTLDRDALDHEAFAESRAQVYIGRDEYFQRLDEHVVGAGPPLVILGESGSGKSALLANWALQYKKENPKDPLVIHFIGASPQSADWADMVRRIMGELKRHFNIQRDIPVSAEDLRKAFADWLYIAATKGKAVIILDALNQLEDLENAPDLVWLPRFIPENIRLIVSTLPGRPLSEIQKRPWPVFKIEALTREERETFIDQYLAQYTKALDPPRIETIAGAEQTKNPLYLKVLLEELRLFGEHERLDERIEHYLEAQDAFELFEKVLVRWEKDYEESGADDDLVGESLSLIWAARRGLSEVELLDILGSKNDPLPHAKWSPLFLAARESLVSRSGLLTFSHHFLREAVAETYIPGESGKKAAHERIADYFENQGLTLRKVEELPWQLCQAESWERLKDCVTDVDMFLKLSTKSKQYELTGYWLAMGDRYDMVAAYQEMIEQYERTAPNPSVLSHVMNDTAIFLYINARYDGVESLYRQTLALREKALGPDHPDTLKSVHNLATLSERKEDYATAQSLYERALCGLIKISRSIGQPHPDMQTFVNNYASCLDKLGYSQEQILEILRELAPEFFNGDDPENDNQQQMTPEQARSMALEFYKSGDYEKACELLELLLSAEFEAPSTHLDLARICLITDLITEAGEHVIEAWKRRAEAEPYIIARLRWFQLAINLLNREDEPAETQDSEQVLGHLKTALQKEDAFMEWTMEPVLDHLKPQLTARNHDLLTALVAALGNSEKLPDLDRFPEWRDAVPQVMEDVHK